MAFRWFRQNDKTTKYIYIGVTIFVMFTFSITGAMLQGLSNDDSKDVAGTFRLPSGDTVEITKSKLSEQMRRYARAGNGRLEEEDVWQRIMLDALARDAGIVVSNEMLKRQMLGQFGTQARIDQILKSIGLSRTEFNELSRDDLRIRLYQQLMSDRPRILDEETFARFQKDNELFQLDYVAFRDSVERAALDAETPSDEDLQAFYDNDLDSFTKNTDFATEERFKLEALVLDLESKTTDELRGMVREISQEVTENDLQVTYTRLKDHRFKTEEEEKEDAPGEDAPAPDEGDDAAEDPDAGYLPLAEVRDQVEKIVLGTRVIAEARQEYYLKVSERKNLQAEKDALPAKGEGETSSGEGETSGEEEAAGEDETSGEAEAAAEGEGENKEITVPSLQDVIDGVATKFGLTQIDFPEPVTAEEVKSLEGGIGADDLVPLVTSMQSEGARSRDTSASVEKPYLIVCEERLSRTPKAFAEVKDELVEPWREHAAKARAQAKGDAFLAALQAAARPKAEEAIAKIEAEAKDAADKEIADKAITDEAEQEKIREANLAARKAEIDALLAPHYGEVFAEVVASQGATVETTAWFEKSYGQTDFYRDDKDSAEKFLKKTGNFEREIGEVVGPLRDDTSGATVFAQVKGRKLPEYTAMGLGDRQGAEFAVMRDKDPEYIQKMMAMYNQQQPYTPSQFSYSTLLLQLGLKRTVPADSANPQE